MAEVDATIRRLQDQPVTPAEFERALTKLRSGLYNIAGSATRFGMVDLLASFALFDDDPALINRIEVGFRQVTPELIQKTAREYLVATNRTVLSIEPGNAQAAPRGGP